LSVASLGQMPQTLRVKCQLHADAAKLLAFLQQQRATRESGRQFIDHIILVVHTKKFGFENVLKQIDDMVQADNDKKKYCDMYLDSADDKKKALERTEEKLEAAIAQNKASNATLSEEIAAFDKRERPPVPRLHHLGHPWQEICLGESPEAN